MVWHTHCRTTVYWPLTNLGLFMSRGNRTKVNYSCLILIQNLMHLTPLNLSRNTFFYVRMLQKATWKPVALKSFFRKGPSLINKFLQNKRWAGKQQRNEWFRLLRFTSRTTFLHLYSSSCLFCNTLCIAPSFIDTPAKRSGCSPLLSHPKNAWALFRN